MGQGVFPFPISLEQQKLNKYTKPNEIKKTVV
jgi:hypothetical protein